MMRQAFAKEFAHLYDDYTCILKGLGFTVNQASILERVAASNQETVEELEQVLAAYSRGKLNGQMLDAQVFTRMETLRKDLVTKLMPETSRLAKSRTGVSPDASGEAWAKVLAAMDEGKRDDLADIILLDGHRQMVQPRKMSVEEFQSLLRQFAGSQTVARQRLVAHLHDELLKRGIEMSHDTIEERFRSNPAVRTMPYCVKQVFKDLGDEFRTGLIRIEELIGQEDPEQWLKRAQGLLKFRSQSAMHKAIAEATGLSYDCIHKALAGRKKAKRIRVEIKECLQGWLAKAQCGQEITVGENRLGVPVEEMCALMPRLRETFRTKEAVYRYISDKTGVRTGSIRRYFQDDGQLKFAPLQVYRVANQLSDSPVQVVAQAPTAPRTPRAAIQRSVSATDKIAKMANRALKRLCEDRSNENLHREFKDLRRKLIVELSERRRRSMENGPSASAVRESFLAVLGNR